VKKPQWITIFIGVLAVSGLFFLGKVKNVEASKSVKAGQKVETTVTNTLTTDSVLIISRSQLTDNQENILSGIEKNADKADSHYYHTLASFWADSAGLFPPYAFYTGEAAKLENSEKSLTFAAHLFLNNLQNEEDVALKIWEAEQAKVLFEKALEKNPSNDSSKVGLGATYLFGNISTNPMQGLQLIREVIDADSLNLFGQMTLAKGAIMTGQWDKAITRLELLHRNRPADIEVILLLADIFERKGDKKLAAKWYKESIPLIARKDVKAEIEKRIEELQK